MFLPVEIWIWMFEPFSRAKTLRALSESHTAARGPFHGDGVEGSERSEWALRAEPVIGSASGVSAQLPAAEVGPAVVDPAVVDLAAVADGAAVADAAEDADPFEGRLAS